MTPFVWAWARPPEIGKQTIRASNERQTANKNFKVLNYVPETKDFTFLDGGWAVEWRTVHCFVCRLAGWRGEARGWHCAGGVQEAPGRQLESFSARWGPWNQGLPPNPVACNVNGRPAKGTNKRNATVAGVLIASMFIGCSYERNIGEAAQTRTPQQPHAGVIDHFVPHISTERANEGSRVSLFMRERRGAPLGPVVLFVHGRSAAAVPSFDLEYRDYSWMVYLADAGFDVFAVDLQGYGSSSKPTVMDDPCNTSADNQAKYLVPNPLPAPCPPRYPHSFGSFATDWDEIDTVVEFIRSLRGDRALKVNLVGWSRGGMRVIGYAALRPDNIEKVVALAPTRFPPVSKCAELSDEHHGQA